MKFKGAVKLAEAPQVQSVRQRRSGPLAHAQTLRSRLWEGKAPWVAHAPTVQKPVVKAARRPIVVLGSNPFERGFGNPFIVGKYSGTDYDG